METVKTAAERYWIIYYLVYLGLAGAGLWYYWPRLLWYWRQPVMQNDSVYLLAAIFGTAAGIALGVAILLEVGGRMVLLIPAAVKKIKAEGHKEGHKEGREEGRKEGRNEERQRIRAALDNLVAPADGQPVLLTPEEVKKILQDEAERSS